MTRFVEIEVAGMPTMHVAPAHIAYVMPADDGSTAIVMAGTGAVLSVSAGYREVARRLASSSPPPTAKLAPVRMPPNEPGIKGQTAPLTGTIPSTPVDPVVVRACINIGAIQQRDGITDDREVSWQREAARGILALLRAVGPSVRNPLDELDQRATLAEMAAIIAVSETDRRSGLSA